MNLVGDTSPGGTGWSQHLVVTPALAIMPHEGEGSDYSFSLDQRRLGLHFERLGREGRGGDRAGGGIARVVGRGGAGTRGDTQRLPAAGIGRWNSLKMPYADVPLCAPVPDEILIVAGPLVVAGMLTPSSALPTTEL